MNESERAEKSRELAQLRERVAALEAELNLASVAHWQATEYYGAYHATSGLMLGIFGAVASLLFNVIGSMLVKPDQNPLRLIQVYLTFPLGEKAFQPEGSSALTLAVGCCLYIGTGMLLGIPFQMIMARYRPRSSLVSRLLLGTVVGLLLWAVNFYLILSWLQPLLFGGDWITNPKYLPPWIGAATHLVFAWTMAILYPWGAYQPYRRQTDLPANSPGQSTTNRATMN